MRNGFEDTAVQLRGDSKRNVFESNYLKGNGYLFEAYEEPEGWTFPSENEMHDDCIRKTDFCYRFFGAFDNTSTGRASTDALRAARRQPGHARAARRPGGHGQRRRARRPHLQRRSELERGPLGFATATGNVVVHAVARQHRRDRSAGDRLAGRTNLLDARSPLPSRPHDR